MSATTIDPTIELDPAAAIALRYSLTTSERAVVDEVIRRIDSRGSLPANEFQILDHMKVGLATALASSFCSTPNRLRDSMAAGPLPIADGTDLAKRLGVSPWILKGWKGERA